METSRIAEIAAGRLGLRLMADCKCLRSFRAINYCVLN
jgi:hypothetical protein